MKSAMPLCMAQTVNPSGGFEVTVGTSDGRIITVDYKTAKLQFEKQVSKNCFKKYSRVPLTREWMIGIDLVTAEKLILEEYNKFNRI